METTEERVPVDPIEAGAKEEGQDDASASSTRVGDAAMDSTDASPPACETVISRDAPEEEPAPPQASSRLEQQSDQQQQQPEQQQRQTPPPPQRWPPLKRPRKRRRRTPDAALKLVRGEGREEEGFRPPGKGQRMPHVRDALDLVIACSNT